MPSEAKTTYRRGPKGELIEEATGKDFDSDAALEVGEGHKKAIKAMTTGAKPVVSTDEPDDKNSVSWMAWKKKQRGKTAEDGAMALAAR